MRHVQSMFKLLKSTTDAVEEIVNEMEKGESVWIIEKLEIQELLFMYRLLSELGC